MTATQGQLDLFGDFIDDIDTDREEDNGNGQHDKADNGSEHLVSGSKGSLGEISSQNDERASEKRNVSSDIGERSREREKSLFHPDEGSENDDTRGPSGSNGAISTFRPRTGSFEKNRNPVNHSIEDDIRFVGGKVKKYEDNIAAITILKTIENEMRFANKEEQIELAKYVGWGGLYEAFDTRKNDPAWSTRVAELKELLTEDEYNAAKTSTLSAFYTEPYIAKAMWKAVQQMGYQGGKTLDPSTGSGIFIGTQPQNTPWKINMTGIDMDHISGRIARQLYQKAEINITPFENHKIAKSNYNLVITNVPFSDFKPYETKKSETPGLGNDNALHDFFILKSIYGTRSGGLISVITSRHTLDKKSTEVRKKIAAQADFIGALRLPNTAFHDIANTNVTSDILFFQKRPPYTIASPLTLDFINTSNIVVKNHKDKESEYDFEINNYFTTHPEMVMGHNSFASSQFTDHEYTVIEKDVPLAQLLETGIKKLPVSSDLLYSIINETPDLENTKVRTEPPVSNFISDDGRLFMRFHDGSTSLSNLYAAYGENTQQITKIMKMVSIADTTRNAIDKYYEGSTQESIVFIDKLNKLYDSYVATYGYLNEPKNTELTYDLPEYNLLCALENYNDKTKHAEKADIFKGITFHQNKQLLEVDTPEDALVQSLLHRGSVNTVYMASLMRDKNPEEIVQSLIEKKLIFADTKDTNNITYVTRQNYLSGNVREKLREAQEASEVNPVVYLNNVRELTQIIPATIPCEDIYVQLNSPFIDQQYIRAFLEETLDTGIRINHIKETGRWDIETYGFSYKQTEYGTDRIKAADIIEKMLNGKAIKIYDKSNTDDPPVYNEEETALAEAKAEKIKTEFLNWIFIDPVRTEDIVTTYNEIYNAHVDPVFIHPARLNNPDNPVYITNCAFPYPLRSNQADAIWRVINSQNTMLAHTVGSGKTMEMCCSAMELKRLGIRNKPMIVVLDKLIDQVAKDFRDAFPTANLLVADDKNWDKNVRRTFLNKAAVGNYDCIIIRMESFKMLPVSREVQEDYFKKKISIFEEVLNNSTRRERQTRSVKDVVKKIEKYKTKIQELGDIHVDEGVIPFDKLGVDHLFVDEADNYKNLEFVTQLENVKGMGTPLGSEKAFDMAMKIEYIQNHNGGITFCTGTPISNSLVEAYTMQRMLQPELLEKQGLVVFDEWSRCYAQVVNSMEQNNTGTGYQAVSRFSKISNLPELMSSLRQVWDIQTADNLEKSGVLVPGVNLPYFKQINLAAPCNPLLKSYLEELARRESNLGGRAEKGADNILCVMTDGRKASLDIRLIDPALPDFSDSKINTTVDLLVSKHSAYKAQSFITVVFCDRPASKNKETGDVSFDVIHDMKKKLIRRGISANEIIDIRDCKTEAKTKAAHNAINNGHARIVFASTKNFGAGVNCQRLLKTIVHLDAPWRPRDIEQQNGRGYRSGNTCGELEVYNVVTKGSLDTGLWNILETKAKSISSIMNGTDKTTREIEEDYFGSVKDLSIDNPLIKEASELMKDIKKLSVMERAINQKIQEDKREIKRIPGYIEKIQTKINNIQDDISTRRPLVEITPTTKNDFSIIIDDKIIVDRKTAGSLIISIMKDMHDRSKLFELNVANKTKEIGSYAGFPLYIALNTLYNDSTIMGKVFVQTDKNNQYRADIRHDSDAVGLVGSLKNSVYTHPEKQIQEYENSIENHKLRLAGLEKNATLAFSDKEILKTKETRLAVVLKTIQDEKPVESKKSLKFPWEKLPSMSKEEIQEIAEIFISDANNVQKDNSIVKKPRSEIIDLRDMLNTKVISALKEGNLPMMITQSNVPYIKNPLTSQIYTGANQLILQLENRNKKEPYINYITISEITQKKWKPIDREPCGIVCYGKKDEQKTTYNYIYPTRKISNQSIINEDLYKQQPIVGVKPLVFEYPDEIKTEKLFTDKFAEMMNCAFTKKTYGAGKWSPEIVGKVIESIQNDPNFILRCTHNGYKKAHDLNEIKCDRKNNIVEKQR